VIPTYVCLRKKFFNVMDTAIKIARGTEEKVFGGNVKARASFT